MGGSIAKGGRVTVVEDKELQSQPEPFVIKVSSSSRHVIGALLTVCADRPAPRSGGQPLL